MKNLKGHNDDNCKIICPEEGKWTKKEMDGKWNCQPNNRTIADNPKNNAVYISLKESIRNMCKQVKGKWLVDRGCFKNLKKNHFILLFTQYKAQEPLKAEGYWMGLLQEEKIRSLYYVDM